jgi:type I restriction enzyme S subunit
VDQISYFNKTVASKDMSGYYLLKNGEYAYNKSYSVGYDFGSVKRLDRYDMGALSTLYICFALKKHDSDFIKAYFDSLKWYREIYMISAEGARNHGLLNVPTDEFFDAKHYIPQDLAEQRKIANFMIALERRIEAQQSLVDNLKKYKRGLLSQLIAQKKAFDTSGEWKTVKLGHIFKERTERAKGNETLLAVTISNGVQRRDEIDLKDNSSDDKSNYKCVYIGDIAYNTMRMWQGASGVSPYNGIVSPAYTIVTPIRPDLHNMTFWAYYFKYSPLVQTFQKYSQGLTSDTWNLKFPQFSEIAVTMPPISEQDKIAECLSVFDEHCKCEDEKLQALLLVRTSLLQQLFI